MKEEIASNMNYNISYWFFLPASLYYSIHIHDIGSNLILFLTLASITAVCNPKRHRYLHLAIAITTAVDLVVKLLMAFGLIASTTSLVVDLSVLQNLAHMGSIDLTTLSYFLLLGLSWTMYITYNIRSKTRVQMYEQLKLLQFLSSTLQYLTPFLLYLLCFTKYTNNNTFREWLQHLSPQISQIQFGHFQMFEQTMWSLLTALYLISNKDSHTVRRLLTMISIILMIRDSQVESLATETVLYQLRWKIVSIIKLALLICWRTHNKHSTYSYLLQQHDQLLRSGQSRISSHMRFVYKRKLSDLNSINHILVFLLLAVTVITVTLTNSLGNIVIIVGIGINFPQFQENRFRKVIALGAIISLLLQPEQFIYFVFLYVIRYFRTHDHHFQQKNWWLLNVLGRIFILLSKVSLLTLLIGLFQNSWLVLFTLMFRTTCSYFNQIVVFMGTDDNYGYYINDNLIPKSITIDLILWTYYLLMRIYSHSTSIKFRGTNITNIFKQYPLIHYAQKILKILKVFHWIAYIVISFFILNSSPSLFTLLRIIPLVVVFTVGILQSHKSQLSYNLWNWNLNTALGIAFVKYFYLLSRYSNLSEWLVNIIQPLIDNHKFIGLTPPDNTSLLVSFGPDFLLIILNAVMLFILKVQMTCLNPHQNQALNNEQQPSELSQRLIQEEDNKNLEYLYINYVKPFDMSFQAQSTMRIVLTDYIMDLCFFSFLFVIHAFNTHQTHSLWDLIVSKIFYLPHFILFFYGFWGQKGKHYPTKVFPLLVFTCSLDLLIIYLRYFIALISRSQTDYNISTLVSKYLLVLIAVIFKQVSSSLEQFYNQNQNEHRQHTFLLSKILQPPLNDPSFKKQILVLYLHWNKILAITCFSVELLATASSNSTSSIIFQIHLWTIFALLLAFIIFEQQRKQFRKRYWIYFILSATLLDLWLGHLSAILCLFGLRGYFMFLQQFDLLIFVQKYDRTNKTDNEQTALKVQKSQRKLKQRFKFSNQNKLDVIDEQKQQRQQSASSKVLIVSTWEQKNAYTTIIWLLPSLWMFIIILGSLFYNVGIYGFSITAVNFIAMVYSLNHLYQLTIDNTVVKVLMLISTILISTSVLDQIIMVGLSSSRTSNLLPYYPIGLFLMTFGTLGYFYMLRYNNHPTINLNIHHSYHIDFTQKRTLQAIQYWRKKCQMVSQLGSQIHNQKKMTSLRKFFLHRQNLGVKVEQLQLQLRYRSNHRKTDYEQLQRLQLQEQQQMKRVDFSVYSNMLTFMSIDDLQFCYLDLNQFYSGDVKDQSDVTETVRNVREWVLINYKHSVKKTLQRYKRQLTPAIQEFQVIKILPILHFQKESSVSTIRQQSGHLEDQMGSRAKLLRKGSSFQFQQLQQHEPKTIKVRSVESLQLSRSRSLDRASRIQEQDQNEISEHKQSEKIIQLRQQEKQQKVEIDEALNTKIQQSFIKIIQMCSFKVPSQNKLPPKEEFRERIDQRLKEQRWPVRVLIQNIQIIGLIVTAGWNFFGGVYTVPTNVAIFSWAIVLETKTTVLFWLFLMCYSFTILSCKLLLAYLPSHFLLNFLFYYHPDGYLYQFLIILVAAIEIVFLKMGGTSEIAYSQRQNIYDAFYRNILNKATKGKEQQGEDRFLKVYKKMRHAHKHSFFYRVFSKGRLKPGKDFYPLLACVQVVILFYIFFFYDSMEYESNNNRKSIGEIMTISQFSKNMIMALFFQVVIMVIDRVIVALNLIDRPNQRIQNFFFSFAFQHNKEYKKLQLDELNNLGLFDFLLIIKYVFHVTLLLLINFFVYLYIPSSGLSKDLIPQCQMAVCGRSYNYLSFFLLLYLAYFVISGLQIKHGFNRNKCRNTLMENYTWKHYYLYLFFTGIPFLWEFKKISDWTTTATSLPLFHWMKFQDINARMYRSKCQAQILRQKQLGKGSWYKPLVGPPGFFFIIAFIFSPIIIYSSFNPFAVKDTIVTASSQLQLVMNHKINYKFFSSSHTTINNNTDLNAKYKLLGFFDRADLYKLQSSSYPDQDFSLSEPALLRLSENIGNRVDNLTTDLFEFKLIMDISEHIGGDNRIQWASKVLTRNQLAAMHEVLTSQANNFSISSFYSPFPGGLDNQTIQVRSVNQNQYFQVYTDDVTKKGEQLEGVFIFYKSSVKYRVAFGLLTFYLTYVVLLNSLFRVYITGSLETITLQGPQMQKILFFCEAVRSARILQIFYQQEYLYFSLVDLMRHPRMIKQISQEFSALRPIPHPKYD